MRPDRLIHRSVALAAMLAATSAWSYTVDYSGARDPQLLPCDRLHWSGEQAEARDCFTDLTFETTDVFVQAEAAWALGDVRRANTLFATAVTQNPENPHIRTRWGYLYLETYQDQEAANLFREARGIDFDYQPARIGLAAAVTSQFRGDVQDEVVDVLEDNATNTRALLILAKLELEKKDTAGARPYLDWALDYLGDDFPPAEIFAMYAAADYIDGITDSPWIERTLEYNPHFGDMFVTLAYFAELTFQYRQAVAFLERGVEVEPRNWEARSALGINLTRINRINEAGPHLEASYAGDPFNIETVNMLRLMDTFDEYILLEDSLDIEVDGETHVVQIQLRLRQDEIAILETYVLELLRKAIPIYVERYEFIPQEPIVIEIYPNHDDFAVRTVGTPGVGLLGVAFGYLFAMDSPTGRSSGEFHWGTVLWHELAHVFTLEASSNRTSRWFSEGLSVFEEWHTGPINGIHMPHYVFDAIHSDRLLPIADLDSGFIRPTYENQIMVSYMQAGLICTFISERWGDEALAAMLRAFQDQMKTAEVVESVLEIRPTAFDREFNAWLQDNFASLFTNYDRWVELQRSIGSAVNEQNWQAVVDLTDASLAIYDGDTESSSAWAARIYAFQELGDEDAELSALQGYFERGGFAPDYLERLAELQSDRGDVPAALETRRALRFVAPQFESLHRLLAENYLETDNPEAALDEWQILLAMDTHDKASVHLGMARSYMALDQNESARRQVLMALEIAPFFREAQQLLFQLTQSDNS